MEQVKENIVVVTPDNFQAEVLECEKPVLVTFYANWDQPCRMQQPALDSIADRHPAQQFGIMMIPTTIAFKNGKRVKRASGLRLEHVLLSMVE